MHVRTAVTTTAHRQQTAEGGTSCGTPCKHCLAQIEHRGKLPFGTTQDTTLQLSQCAIGFFRTAASGMLDLLRTRRRGMGPTGQGARLLPEALHQPLYLRMYR